MHKAAIHMPRSRTQHKLVKEYSDVITLDTYSEEAASSLSYCLKETLLRNHFKTGRRQMTNQQLSDAFRREPAILLSDGDKLISYKEGLKLAKANSYVQKIRVKFNMATAEKVGTQREYYDWCTMDAVIEHDPELKLVRAFVGKNGTYGFKASLLPDAERNAEHILKTVERVRELRDVPVSFKTELCRYHFKCPTGCVNGGRCHFAHSRAELRDLAPRPPTPTDEAEAPESPTRLALARKPATPPTPAPWRHLAGSF